MANEQQPEQEQQQSQNITIGALKKIWKLLVDFIWMLLKETFFFLTYSNQTFDLSKSDERERIVMQLKYPISKSLHYTMILYLKFDFDTKKLKVSEIKQKIKETLFSLDELKIISADFKEKAKKTQKIVFSILSVSAVTLITLLLGNEEKEATLFDNIVEILVLNKTIAVIVLFFTMLFLIKTAFFSIYTRKSIDPNSNESKISIRSSKILIGLILIIFSLVIVAVIISPKEIVKDFFYLLPIIEGLLLAPTINIKFVHKLLEQSVHIDEYVKEQEQEQEQQQQQIQQLQLQQLQKIQRKLQPLENENEKTGEN